MEVRALQDAIANNNLGSIVKLSYVVLQEAHNTRMFPKKRESATRDGKRCGCFIRACTLSMIGD